MWRNKFNRVIYTIGRLYPEGLSQTEFSRQHLFYSLFTSVAHCLYGISGIGAEPVPLEAESEIESARNRLDQVDGIFQARDITALRRSEQRFIEDSRRATTDEAVRQRRTEFLLALVAP